MSQPDRTSLPIRREAFAGVANRTLEGSQPDWNLIGHPTPRGRAERPPRPDRRCRVRQPGTFGGPIQTPNYTRMAEGGLRYNRFHVTALCSPTRGTAHRQEQSRRGVRPRSASSRRVPRLPPRPFHGLRATAADPAGQRVQHGRVRQVASDTGRAAGPAGPFDRWPNGWGFDYFYGILGGGSSQWDSVSPRTRRSSARPRASTMRTTLLFPGCDGRSNHRVAPRGARRMLTSFFVYYSTGCSHAPHHVANEWADNTRASSTRMGQGPRGDLRPSEGARSCPPDAELTLATRRSWHGTTCPTS